MSYREWVKLIAAAILVTVSIDGLAVALWWWFMK
jgi:hypothetical protein